MGLFGGLAPIVGAGLGYAVAGPAGGLIGASIGGGMSTNDTQRDIAQEANQFSAQQSAAQMEFQKQMRATQYQTAVEDLKAAGLNPMLAYSQGGAGNLAGSAAVGQQATLRNPYEGLASSASQLAQVKADIALKDTAATKNVADTMASEKQAQYTDALAASEVMRMPGIPEQIKKITAERLNLESQKELNSAMTQATNVGTLIRQSGDLPEAVKKGEYYKGAPYNPFYLKDFTQGLSSAGQAVRSLR